MALSKAGEIYVSSGWQKWADKIYLAPQPSSWTPNVTVTVGGKKVTAADLKSAIAALEANPNALVLPTLKNIGSPLADVDFKALAAIEMKSDETLRVGKQKTKKALLVHLTKKLVAATTKQLDADPNAVNVKTGSWAQGGEVPAPPAATSNTDKLLASITADVPVEAAGSPVIPAGQTFTITFDSSAPSINVVPDPPQKAGYHDHLGTPPHKWPKAAKQAYVNEFHLDVIAESCCWDPKYGCGPSSFVAQAIATHYDTVLAEKLAAEAAILKFSAAADQPTLGGYHRKLVLTDQHGGRWLFKPAPDGKAFRAQTAHGAHLLARAWGFKTVESRLIDFDGEYGQAQRMLVESGNFAGVTAAAFAGYTQDQLIGVACEHLLDWALDNDDTKGDNLLIAEGGAVVGVDKDRAWVYFGGWDGLSSHDSANSNAPLVYTELYRAVKKGHLAQDRVDPIFRAVIAKARRMQRLSDVTVTAIVTDAVANRPHYKPPSYRMPFAGAPTNADELIAAVLARKNSLAADIHALWERVYADAGWQLPDLTAGTIGVNAQGHPIHVGLHSPALHTAVGESKSYGTPTFVAGKDVEDAHVLLWREKANGVFRVRGQLKLRGQGFRRVKSWCVKHATNVDKPKPETKVPKSLVGETDVYQALIAAAKTISHHADDGAYNQDTLRAYGYMKRWATARRDATAKSLEADEDDPYGVLRGTHDMCQTYLGYMTTIDKHKADKTRSQEGDFPRFQWKPTLPETAKAEQPELDCTVELRTATRAAARQGYEVVLADDGELHLDGTALAACDWGQPGYMYLVTLPTGEQIEFRADTSTETPLSTRGQMMFTVPDENDIAAGLARIDAQLNAMGLHLQPATGTDLELFYWRHLAGIMNARRDSNAKEREGYNCEPVPATYPQFWEKANLLKKQSPEAEIEMWRDAFAVLTSREQIEAFVAAEGHLPRFMHMDLRQPELACGKPYWERCDVTDEQWRRQQMPSSTYRSGPRWVMATGVCMATEARARTFAIWKTGMSSSEDMEAGSAAFIFARQNLEDGRYGPTVYFNPRVLLRTSNYGLNGDCFGRLTARREFANFTFDWMVKCTNSSNELLIKDAMSLLDDVEILAFKSPAARNAAIAKLAGFGITEIRGVPVATRFVLTGDNAAVTSARVAVRKQWTDGTEQSAECLAVAAA